MCNRGTHPAGYQTPSSRWRVDSLSQPIFIDLQGVLERVTQARGWLRRVCWWANGAGWTEGADHVQPPASQSKLWPAARRRGHKMRIFAFIAVTSIIGWVHIIIHKYTNRNTQTHKHTNTQIHKYTNIQMQIHKCKCKCIQMYTQIEDSFCVQQLR